MKEEQQIVLPKPKRDPSEGDLDITPMIDIVFLLLSFFVVVSKMDPQPAIDLPKASHSDALSEKSAVQLVAVDEGDGYNIFLGRNLDPATLVTATDPAVQEMEIGSYIEKELSADPSKEAILVKASGNVRTRVVQILKQGIEKSELGKSKKIYVGVLGED